MTKPLTALTVVTILAAMAAAGTVKTKTFHPVGAMAVLPTVAISVEELQRRVNVRVLLVTEIENLY